MISLVSVVIQLNISKMLVQQNIRSATPLQLCFNIDLTLIQHCVTVLTCFVDTCCTDKSNTALYTGKLSLTQSGEQCQPWVDQKSFQLDYSNDSLFLNDGTAVEAGNYCRDPDQSGVIWCYTLSDLDRRDKCEPPKCNSKNIFYHLSFLSDQLDANPYCC